jgi:hypothetical protein
MVNNMDYTLIRTVHGPAVMGEGEVLFLNQFQQLVDYIDGDPNFVENAKKFISDEIRQLGNDIADSFYKPVLGGDLTQLLHMYLNSVQIIAQLEHNFIPSLHRH